MGLDVSWETDDDPFSRAQREVVAARGKVELARHWEIEGDAIRSQQFLISACGNLWRAAKFIFLAHFGGTMAQNPVPLETAAPAESMFESPLVQELYELAQEVVIPRIDQMEGFPGGVIKGFVQQYYPLLPEAFKNLDRDLPLQRQIMDQLGARYARLEPVMEEYFASHAT